MKCPSCQGPPMKVLYLGLPMRMCKDPCCATVWGFWANATYLGAWLPLNGDGFMFAAYEGSYWPALWRWLWRGPS